MSSIVLDAGALIAVDRGDRSMLARLKAAQDAGTGLRTSAIVVAEAWRDSGGRQARLARLLQATDVRPVDEAAGRAAGELLGRASASTTVDAVLVLVAEPGDVILTSDTEDVGRLVDAAGARVTVAPC